MNQRSSRFAAIGSPSTWVLALALCFLPFLSVSCDAPGGFGRMEAGGTTTWSGFDLAAASAPSVDDTKLRPEAAQESDDIGWQPVVAVGMVGLAGAIVIATRKRWIAAAATSLAALGLIVIGVLLARSTLVDMVALQVTDPFADGKSAGDHVALGIGFWLVIVLTAIGAILAMVASKAAIATRSRESDVTADGHEPARSISD